MKKNNGFALLEVLLAVILIAIVTGGSYALVKSISSNSAMQKFTRYSTSIAENYKPFLDASVETEILSDKGTLSRDFLKSIYIPDHDLGCNSTGDCVVLFDLPGMHANPNYMKFRVIKDHITGTHFFVIEIYDEVPAGQKNQMLQSLGSVFSLYCPIKACQLGPSASYVRLVYPKAGGTLPS